MDQIGLDLGGKVAGGGACGGGRCGPISGEVEAGDSGWDGSTACVGARGGEGQFTSARGWLELELAVVAWSERRRAALVRWGGPARHG
jgi:hypothetical protein